VIAAAILYLLTILIPINGILYMGIRQERLRNRRILLEQWRLGRRRP
jgi:hypothetical protein